MVGFRNAFCTFLKSSVISNWHLLEASKCQALCYMLVKNNYINNHASPTRQALLSHFIPGELIPLVNHLLIIPPENHRARIQPQGVLVLEFNFQSLCYMASLTHFHPMQTPKLLKYRERRIRCESISLSSWFLLCKPVQSSHCCCQGITLTLSAQRKASRYF